MAKKMMGESPSKRVGLWIRVSTEDQAKGESPQHHEARARAYAESKGWSIVETYHLEGVSGKAVIDHPEAKKMLKDVERGHITGLIFSKLARLGRNIRELLEFSDRFEKHGADLISLQESIDTSTPAGRLFYTLIAAMAHWEREEIAERVRASVPIRAKLGKRLGGGCPYGYQWINNQLVPHPEEAPVRKLIHELFVEHKRKKRVVRLLTEAGYRNRKGKPFSITSIRSMLDDPTPKGQHRANYLTQATNGERRWIRKPESEWIYHGVEPILSAELWDQANEIYCSQITEKRPPAKKAVQLFAGVAHCACGQKMYVPSNTPKYVCQKCRRKIPVVDLEEIFLEQIKNYLLSPEDMKQYLLEGDQTLQSKLELLDHLEKERLKVRQEMDRMFKLFMDQELTSRGFGERYRPHEERLVQLEEELPRLQGEIDFLKVNLVSRDEIFSRAQRLTDHWPNMDQEAKRRLVETLVEKITIGDQEIEIDLYFLPGLIHESTAPQDDDEDDTDDPPTTPTHHPKSRNPIKSADHSSDKVMAKRVRNLMDVLFPSLLSLLLRELPGPEFEKGSRSC